MKKLILTVIIILFGFNSQMVFANKFELTVDEQESKPGQEVTINLTFTNNPGIIAALFDLQYDKERLELIKAEDKGLLSGAVFSKSYSDYPYKMVWNSSSAKNFTENGTLVTLTFKVAENAKSGKAYINISYKPDDVFDVDLNNVALQINNGSINIQNETTTTNIENTVSKDFGYSPSGTSNKKETQDKSNTNDTETKPITNNHSFADVKTTDWYFEAVNYVVENKLMNGVSDTVFAPNSPLTRGMLVTVLYRNEGNPMVDSSANFNDISNNMYYADAVSWAWQNKIVNGISETTFAPDELITREQIAAIMYRYATYKNYNTAITNDTNLQAFSDASEISKYATTSFKYAISKNLINGKTDTTLNPDDTATRAETATILMRFLEINK